MLGIALDIVGGIAKRVLVFLLGNPGYVYLFPIAFYVGVFLSQDRQEQSVVCDNSIFAI